MRQGRWLGLGVLVCVLALLAPACSSADKEPTPASDGPVDEDAGDTSGETGADVVTATDNSFDPATLVLPAGEEVELTITNEGSSPHTFTIDSLEIDTGTIDPGGSASATFVVPDEPVEFYCAIHGAGVMSGTIESE